MRILYFSRAYTSHDYRFLAKMGSSQHEIFFLRLEPSAPHQEKRALPSGVTPVYLKGGGKNGGAPWDNIPLVPHLEETLSSLSPDLVHAGPVQTCGFLAALTGTHPFLCMSWGSDILFDAEKDAGWQWVTRYTLKHSDWLLCDCDAVKDAVRRMVVYPDERILKIPWGIDLKTLHSGKNTGGIREELGWSASFIVLSTRMWEDLSGIETLLSAFATAFRRNPSLRLLLPGDGSRAPHIRKFIHDHGLNEVIHMPGVIANDRIPEYFSASDLYVSCSFSDGTSVSLLEAMGHGLPVLVSDIPGNREWVVHNENGWLAEAGNGQAFSEGVVTASRLSGKKRKEISEINRAIIETRADWDKNSQQLLHLYNAIEDAHD